MKKRTQKAITFTALMTIAAGVIHAANRFIVTASQLKEILEVPSKEFYNWRFGQVYYTKRGTGTPLLLLHDMLPGSSGYEWKQVEEQLAQNHTVYSVDLPGCGRSEKSGITYTNFVYVQFICDFVRDVIQEKTDIIASGFSGSFVTMASLYDKTIINKIMLINPPSLASLTQEPTEKDKLLSCLLKIPVFGTFIYHIAVSRETSSSLFLEKLYYNPFHASKDMMDAYYEASHRGGYYAKYLYISMISKYMTVNINNALKTIDNSIYILSGKEEPNSELIAEDYKKINPSIESVQISKTKHIPHVEAPEAFMDYVTLFFS